jgi:hypothetical protein
MDLLLALTKLLSPAVKIMAFAWRVMCRVCAAVAGFAMLPVLEQADRCYRDLRNWQRRWDRLAPSLSYKLDLKSRLFDGADARSCLYIRNTGEQPVHDLEIDVTAMRGLLDIPQPVLSVSCIDPGRVVMCPLESIPLVDMNVRQGDLWVSFDSLRIRVNRYDIGDRQISVRSGETVCLLHDDFLNQRWLRFKGRLFNVKAIEEYQREVMLALYARTLWPHGLLGFATMNVCAEIRRSGSYRAIPAALVFALLSSPPVLASYCWTMLLLRRRRLVFNPDGSCVVGPSP